MAKSQNTFGDCIGDLVKAFFAVGLWFIMSTIPPFGALGNLFFRLIMGEKLDDRIWTYFISTIPFVGPMFGLIGSIV